jgi:hypothetical protein
MKNLATCICVLCAVFASHAQSADQMPAVYGGAKYLHSYNVENSQLWLVHKDDSLVFRAFTWKDTGYVHSGVLTVPWYIPFTDAKDFVLVKTGAALVLVDEDGLSAWIATNRLDFVQIPVYEAEIPLTVFPGNDGHWYMLYEMAGHIGLDEVQEDGSRHIRNILPLVLGYAGAEDDVLFQGVQPRGEGLYHPYSGYYLIQDPQDATQLILSPVP